MSVKQKDNRLQELQVIPLVSDYPSAVEINGYWA